MAQLSLTPAEMGIPNYEGTYLDFLDFRVVEAKPGFVRMRMMLKKSHSNTLGMAHGGVIMSMLDIAGAFAAHAGERGDEVSVTMTQSTSFVRPVTGDMLFAEGRITRRVGRTAFTQSVVLDPSHGEQHDEQVCATAQCSFKLRQRERDAGGDGGAT